jgi:hypothetical protein
VALIRLPPTCTLALLAGAVGLALRRGRRRRALAALLPAGALAIVLVVQPLDLGLRYALPVLAAGMVLAGSLLATRSRAALVVLVIVVLGQLGSAVVATPHSLAWTSPVFRPGFRWTADLDIGQDRRDVVRWSAHRTARTALLLEPGQAGPPGDGLLIGVDPSAIIGWVVVSSALLTTLARDELAWLRKYCPVHAIGGTVLVYRFARAPDPSAGPARPRDLCARRFSDRR